MGVRAVLLGFVLFGGGLLLGAAPAVRRGDVHEAANQAFMKASEKMSQEMRKMPMVGDPDVDFANMMIAHHQGAIDMANVELRYGTDPELRATAQKIVDEQTREVDALERWLKDREQVR